MKMSIKMIMFDLDGTLLPMDMEEFTGGYFKLLAPKMIAYGYETDKLVKSIWHGTGAMVRNNGSCSNEEAFWKDFAGIIHHLVGIRPAMNLRIDDTGY